MDSKTPWDSHSLSGHVFKMLISSWGAHLAAVETYLFIYAYLLWSFVVVEWWNATISDTGVLPKMVLGCFCYFGNLQHSKDRLFNWYTSMAGAKGHEVKQHNNILAGQWIRWGHGWAPDSNPKKREWAGESRKKLRVEELCEKVSICSTCWREPKANKLKLNHRKTANLCV